MTVDMVPSVLYRYKVRFLTCVMSRFRTNILVIAVFLLFLAVYRTKLSFDDVTKSISGARRTTAFDRRYLMKASFDDASTTFAQTHGAIVEFDQRKLDRRYLLKAPFDDASKTFAKIHGAIAEFDQRKLVKASIKDANNTKNIIRRSITAFNESYHKEKTSTESEWIVTEPQLPLCVIDVRKFHGREPVNLTDHRWQTLEKKFNDTLQGGRWQPKGCKAMLRVAIIIPFRDRDSHLKILMLNVLPKLQRQQLDYTIFVVEQAPGNRFNRGMLRNIGFVEANKTGHYDCYIFNDVDTIIEDDRNLFRCDIRGERTIRHIAVLVNAFKYKLLYSYLIGGILSVTYKQFVTVNGYSNAFFVWGGEDDDLFRRFHNKGYLVSRPSNSVSYTTTLSHERDPMLAERTNIYNNIKYSSEKDGVNAVDGKYEIILREERKLFTWLYVRVNETMVQKSLDFIKNIALPRHKRPGGKQKPKYAGLHLMPKNKIKRRHLHKRMSS